MTKQKETVGASSLLSLTDEHAAKKIPIKTTNHNIFLNFISSIQS